MRPWAATVAKITYDIYVKFALARDPHTAPELLEELSYDEDEGVRWEVAGNLSTPVHVLVRLSKDPALRVRWGVATNDNTPVETLMELAQDKTYDVRRGVEDNPRTPSMVKLWLTAGQYGGMALEEFLKSTQM